MAEWRKCGEEIESNNLLDLGVKVVATDLCGLRDIVVWTSTHDTVVYNKETDMLRYDLKTPAEELEIILYSIAFLSLVE